MLRKGEEAEEQDPLDEDQIQNLMPRNYGM
jgi:hypothetical protein